MHLGWENLKSNDTEGMISKKAAKRIERAVTWMLFYAKRKYIFDVELQKRFSFLINFITLSLPSAQIHSDDEIKKVCLESFLDKCRKYINLKNYVWKAEAQLNGNIHFHIVTDTYIRYDKIQEWWNDSVNLLGYVDRFEKKVGHRHPNSTDVHSVKHVKKVASYIAKYMSKNRAFKCIGELRLIKGKEVEILYGSDQYRREEAGKKEGKVIANIIAGPIRKTTGKLWYLSRSLSGCKGIRINEDDHNFIDIQTLIQKSNLHEFSTDFCTNYYGKVATASKVYAPWLYELMQGQAPALKNG
jgi:hypothetical protein